MSTSKAYKLHKCLKSDDELDYIFKISNTVAAFGILFGLVYIGFMLYFVTY